MHSLLHHPNRDTEAYFTFHEFDTAHVHSKYTVSAADRYHRPIFCLRDLVHVEESVVVELLPFHGGTDQLLQLFFRGTAAERVS
jgi:hypothetical protein